MRGEGKKILAFLMAGTIAFGAFGCKKKNKNTAGRESEPEDTGRHEQHISLTETTVNVNQVQLYTSREIKLDPVLNYDKEQLVEGTDYTVTYTDNTLPGIGEMTISGMGTFTGVVKIPFQIVLNEEFCDDPLHADTLYFVKDFYEEFLGRLPSRDEWVNYTKGLGTKSLTVSDFFTAVLEESKEYSTKNISDFDTIEKAYNLILGRGMTDEEKADSNKTLQSKSETAMTILRERFKSQMMIDACLKKNLYSVKLDLSEQELLSAMDLKEDFKWVGDPVIEDFDGDGFKEAVRQAGRTTGSGYETVFYHTDGYHTYEFTRESGLAEPYISSWVIMNDSGKSFVYRLAWPNGTPGQVNYNGRIIGFSRETFTVQLHGEFGDVVNPDVNSVVLVYFDHGGTEYSRKTFQFKDGKYQPVS